MSLLSVHKMSQKTLNDYVNHSQSLLFLDELADIHLKILRNNIAEMKPALAKVMLSYFENKRGLTSQHIKIAQLLLTRLRKADAAELKKILRSLEKNLQIGLISLEDFMIRLLIHHQLNQ